MRWPMGPGGDLAARFARCFAYFLEMALPLGVVWVAGEADGLAVWTAPEQREAWELHPWDQPRILAVADDGGRSYEAFWEWVATHDPTEPSWQLDTIAVEPGLQGRGIGRALVEAGLARARGDGTSAFLSTGTPANVAIHGSLRLPRLRSGRRTGRRPTRVLVHALGPRVEHRPSLLCRPLRDEIPDQGGAFLTERDVNNFSAPSPSPTRLWPELTRSRGRTCLPCQREHESGFSPWGAVKHLLLAKLATQHVVDPSDGMAVEPSALLSKLTACTRKRPWRKGPVAPLSHGERSPGRNRLRPARRQSRASPRHRPDGPRDRRPVAPGFVRTEEPVLARIAVNPDRPF